MIARPQTPHFSLSVFRANEIQHWMERTKRSWNLLIRNGREVARIQCSLEEHMGAQKRSRKRTGTVAGS